MRQVHARADPGTLKGGPFRIFQHPLLQNIKKLKGGPFGEKNSLKKSLNADKIERGTLLDFSTSILS